MSQAVLARSPTRACTEDPTCGPPTTTPTDRSRSVVPRMPLPRACREQTIDSINRVTSRRRRPSRHRVRRHRKVDSDAHTVASARELAAQINRPFSVLTDRRNGRRDARCRRELPNLSPEEIDSVWPSWTPPPSSPEIASPSPQ